jgi:DNA helicase-2/ATP-dependent DNA helicase PcrA
MRTAMSETRDATTATDDATTTLKPRAREQRRRAPSLIDVDLDPAQRGAVELPRGRALLVLGEAGHGKTTVALHRLAHLQRSFDGLAAPRIAVIVPTEGLTRLLQPLLRRLGLDVEAQTYGRWAAAQARRALRGLPRRESEQAGPLVARLKRDPAVRVGLEELGRRSAGRIDDDVDAAPGPHRALVSRGDLQHLFGDRALLDAVARASGSITSRAIDEVLEHTRIQFSRSAEDEWSHVTDRERLVALDGRALDDATAASDAATIDAEDYAVLFELDRIRAASLARPAAAPRRYDVIALDEAQELAPLELALIRRSLAPGGTFVVAGDVDQQTDATTTFDGWGAAMRELGCSDHAVVELDVGYRCPAGIAQLARRIRSSPARADAPPPRDTSRPGIEPALLRFANERALTDWFGRAIASLRRRDPGASVAVVCRLPSTAQRIAAALRPAVPVRLVFDGRFFSRGPAQVTVVDEVKGLEFDFVLLPDATEAVYPDNPGARRALYVALTRARHQVLFAAATTPTPLLGGLIATPHPPVVG